MKVKGAIELLFRQKYNINVKKEETEKAKSKMEILLERKEALENLSMWGANTVIEYKTILEQLNMIEKEGNYTEWFYRNRKQIEELFTHMKEHFVENGEVFEIPYSTEDRLVYAGNVFIRNYLIELLRRYEYKCNDRVWNGKRWKLEIRYKD